MKGVQRRRAVHMIDSEEAFDAGEGDSESEYHNK
jgi:hypothetical protein